jgi:hypothetical protein
VFAGCEIGGGMGTAARLSAGEKNASLPADRCGLAGPLYKLVHSARDGFTRIRGLFVSQCRARPPRHVTGPLSP